jgi:hypothetical protein
VLIAAISDQLNVPSRVRRIPKAFCPRFPPVSPQHYIAYRKQGVTVMLHSMSNARDQGPNCLDTLNVREVPTRCADNRLWAVVNNASNSYSHWGSFVARPDATIAKQLPINQPGILLHDFPGHADFGIRPNPSETHQLEGFGVDSPSA